MTPDWSQAPEWARYTAMDSDGTWYWYGSKPEIGDGAWVSQTHESARITKDWTESLQTRPEAT